MNPWKALVAAALALALTACAAPVEIVAPAPATAGTGAAAADPVTRYQVHFGSSYKGGFRANLDGQDITAAFSPPPAPGGVSTAAQSAFAAGSGVFGRFGTPFWSHELFVAAECRWYCAGTAAVVDFTPPSLRFSANDIPLRQGSTITLWVEVDKPPSQPLTVAISASTGGSGGAGALSLDGQPPGTPVTVTIPPGGTNAAFSLTAGRRRGRFLVTASAPGCQGNGIYGFVLP
jgi:hypothetical protein